MVFVNSRLGNGFKIKEIDSSKHQEHYTSGASAFVRYKIRSAGVAGIIKETDETESVAMVTGSDIDNVFFDVSQSRDFIGDLTASVSRFGVRAVIDYDVVPALTQGFSAILYQDGNSSDYTDAVDVTNQGTSMFTGLTSDGLSGSYSWVFDITDGKTAFAFPPDQDEGAIPEVVFSVTASSDVDSLTLRDVRVEFDQNLPNFGVERYKDIDNQNTEIFNINRNLMPIVPENIREVSYYGWQSSTIIGPTPSTPVFTFNIHDVATDSHGWLYAVGQLESNWLVRRSKDGGLSWQDVDSVDDGVARGVDIDSNDVVYVVGKADTDKETIRRSVTGDSGSFELVCQGLSGGDLLDVAINSSDRVFAGGRARNPDTPSSDEWAIYGSDTGDSGSFVVLDQFVRDYDNQVVQGLAVSPTNDYVYAAGYEQVGEVFTWIVRRSTTGTSGSFVYVDSIEGASGNGAQAKDVAVGPDGSVYVVGYRNEDGGDDVVLARRADAGASGTFEDADHLVGDGTETTARGVSVDSRGNVYYCGIDETDDSWFVRNIVLGVSGSGEVVDTFSLVASSIDNGPNRVAINSNDNIFVVGNADKESILRDSRLTANSASLGPRMLTTSVHYVQSEIQGIQTMRFRLNNITEFPHSSGLFQMPNMVLGTVDTGTVGNTEDNIIQINYFGSVVRIMWPKQADQNLVVDGFGDSAAGQRSGKLTDQFMPGGFVDVAKFDHLTLYAYLLKNMSGTLDNVDVKIERRPLRSVGFATDQTITYTTSGSDTVAELKDLVYRKQVDYGDLSLKEIGYPIDIPLTNVREVRVSAKQVTGQVDDGNKNLIIWGRLISSDDET